MRTLLRPRSAIDGLLVLVIQLQPPAITDRPTVIRGKSQLAVATRCNSLDCNLRVRNIPLHRVEVGIIIIPSFSTSRLLISSLVIIIGILHRGTTQQLHIIRLLCRDDASAEASFIISGIDLEPAGRPDGSHLARQHNTIAYPTCRSTATAD